MRSKGTLQSTASDYFLRLAQIQIAAVLTCQTGSFLRT